MTTRPPEREKPPFGGSPILTPGQGAQTETNASGRTDWCPLSCSPSCAYRCPVPLPDALGDLMCALIDGDELAAVLS